MKIIFFVILFGIFSGCVNRGDVLHESFTENELQTVNKLIDFYDEFILSKNNNNLNLAEAYRHYLNATVPNVIETGDLAPLLPAPNERIHFFETLDSVALSEIFNITDTVKIKSEKSRKLEKVYSPFSFSLNYTGKIIDFLSRLSNRNSFYKEFYEDVMSAGDISPISLSMMLKEYSEIDFAKKEERFVFIIVMLDEAS